MTPAERIEELEAEVAYLRSEMGLSLETSKIMAIKRELGLRHQEAQILAVLHAAYPRALTRYQLWDALDHPHDGMDEFATNSINVRISGIRRKAGRDLVDVVQRLGIRLTSTGAKAIENCVDLSTGSPIGTMDRCSHSSGVGEYITCHG